MNMKKQKRQIRAHLSEEGNVRFYTLMYKKWWWWETYKSIDEDYPSDMFPFPHTFYTIEEAEIALKESLGNKTVYKDCPCGFDGKTSVKCPKCGWSC